MERVVVVTGANRGLGFAIVGQLAKKNEAKSIIYVGARNEDRGKDAVAKLKMEGADNVTFLKIDLEDESSIENAAKYILKEHGGLDVLINNAAFKAAKPIPPAKEKEDDTVKTIAVNYYGTKRVLKYMQPILRKNGRIVNISSVAGVLDDRFNKEIRQSFLSPDLTEEDLDALMQKFLLATKNGTATGNYPSSYCVSKTGVNVLTQILARKESDGSKIIVACCPGRVKTDMSQGRGTKTPEQGADTPVWLATDKSADFHGKFYADRNIQSWTVL
eukprot:TRINITY_DN1620_c0_g1_i2.p1 TRINITY_DN1620_c0_g1~~TRINITY_DN1620_c0_g1_i2.p1  ORF type:complete len:285 (+),score=67.12 TRINITY_DN1620_c0_g1_i2:35-856(+)